GRTVAETRQLGEQGKQQGGAAVEAITAMLGKDLRFAGMMRRMEGTLQGRLSALNDTRAFAEADATRGLSSDLSGIIGAGLQQTNAAERMAAGVNTALAPVSGLIRSSAEGLLGGSLISGLSDGIIAGKSLISETVGSLAIASVIGPFKSLLGIDSPSKVYQAFGVSVVEGFENGLVDRTSAGFARWAKAIEQAGGDAFIKGIEAMARRLGIDPADVMNMIAAESRFNPRARNPLPGQTASGLIQLTEQSARSLGTSTRAVRGMSGVEQIPFIERYLRQRGVRSGDTLSNVYGAVGYGTARKDADDILFSRGSNRYRLNARAWDVNRDGLVRFGELGQYAARQGGFTTTGSANTEQLAAGALKATAGLEGFAAALTSARGALDGGHFRPGQMADFGGVTIDGGHVDGGTVTASAERLLTTTTEIGTRLSGIPETVNQIAPGFARAASAAGTFYDSVVGRQERYAGLMAGTWGELRAGFEGAFVNAFGNVEQGFGRMGPNLLIGFAQLLQQMALQATAARIGEAIFGTAASGGAGWKGGFLGWLLKAVGIVAGGAAAGSGGGTSFSSPFSPYNAATPGLAGGGYAPSGSMAWVGEKGPELVRFGDDARVFSHQDSRRMMAGARGGGTYNDNRTYHIALPPQRGSDGYTQRRSQRELAETLRNTLHGFGR
ncbi:MAG: transglycosylase SLT domain-containing protein, partial [Pyrinomonadaceae bacterium]